VERCNQCHLIVVPSAFCKQAFLSSGVSTPIRVVNHGLEPEYHPYDDVRRRDEVFEFFNTFGVFAPPQRKGCEELIRSFLSAFGGRTDTRLLIRTHIRGPILEYSKKYKFDRLIVLKPLHYVPIEQYARLLGSVHCVVYPSRGEGFGLVPLQAIACETPVIAPYASGMTEYLSNNTATLVKTSGMSRGPSWDNQPGYYYDIDEKDLTQKLIDVRENWQKKREMLAHHASAFRRRFSWSNVVRPFVEELKQLIG
jgi:glycosyltransferase involved in cell wall biosynthesis